MKVIVGLGNPGNEYGGTRHNVGFEVVDELVKKLDLPTFSFKPKLQAEIIKQGDLLVIKPLTYMNRSGQAVRAVLEYFGVWQPQFPLHEMYVVHDDLDIQLGAYKFMLAVGPKQHNGLLSLYEHLGTKEFWHVRVGVDGRGGDRSMPPDRYVLQAPSSDERIQLDQVTAAVVEQMTRELT